MRYEFSPQVYPKEISELRYSVVWNKMEEYHEYSSKSSYFYICCYEDNKLIGFLDVVSNGVTDAYIQDVMVNPYFQGQCVGTILLNSQLIN